MSKNSFVEQHYGIARVEIVEVGEEDSDEYDEEDLGIAMRRDEHINMESIQRIINGVVPPRQEDEAEEEEDEAADSSKNVDNQETALSLNSDKQVTNLDSSEKRLSSEDSDVFYDSVDVDSSKLDEDDDHFEDSVDKEMIEANSTNKKNDLVSVEGTEDKSSEKVKVGKANDGQVLLVEQSSIEGDEQQSVAVSSQDSSDVDKKSVSSGNEAVEASKSSTNLQSTEDKSSEKVKVGKANDGQVLLVEQSSIEGDEQQSVAVSSQDRKKKSIRRKDFVKKRRQTKVESKQQILQDDAENDSEIELIEFPSFSKKDNLKKSLIKRSVSKAIIKNNSEKKVVTSFKKKRRIQFEKKTCKDDVPNLVLEAPRDKTIKTGNEDSVDKKDPPKAAEPKETDQTNEHTEEGIIAVEKPILKVQSKEADKKLTCPKKTTTNISSVDEEQSTDKTTDVDMVDNSERQLLKQFLDRVGNVKRRFSKTKPKKTSVKSSSGEMSSSSAVEDNDNSKSEEEIEQRSVKPTRKFLIGAFNNEKPDLTHPRYRKPLEMGWVRELVYRNLSSNDKRTRFADVYYYTPKGKKLRSSIQVKQYLPRGLSLKNFTFAKESLGINDNVREIVRSARVSLNSKFVDNKRAVANNRRIKELKRYLKAKMFSSKKKTANYLSKNPFKAAMCKKSEVVQDSESETKFSNDEYTDDASKPFVAAKKCKKSEVVQDSESETKHSNDEYSEDDDKMKRSTCTQKCPKALHFIPTILCIDCEMKFHPQCEGITLEDESDFEDLTPIVDYICKKCRLIRHRNAGEPLRYFPTPSSSPSSLILPPTVQLDLHSPEKKLDSTSTIQMPEIDVEVGRQQVDLSSSTADDDDDDDDDETEIMSPMLSQGESESDENSTEDSEANEIEDQVYAENASFIENSPPGEYIEDVSSEPINEAQMSFNKQDGAILLLTGDGSNPSMQVSANGELLISQNNRQLVCKGLLGNDDELNLNCPVNEGKSTNQSADQQIDQEFDEIVPTQIEPSNAEEYEMVVNNSECGNNKPTLTLMTENGLINLAIAGIVDEEYSARSLKEIQSEGKSTAKEEQMLESMADSENSTDHIKHSDAKKEEELILKKARNMKPPCHCALSKTTDLYKCKIFTEAERAIIYHKFWKNLSWKKKKKFVDALVERSGKSGDGRSGEDSCIFNLEKNGERYRVCRKMFLNTLGIGEWSLNNWLKNIHDGYKPRKYWNDLTLR
ncbi:uncharacterized protein isoform X4 [Rhodnius prolixus]|uniref:uncharacterized protein isoform X4 n=1 Tax=Rhodnius prolixus TaxID=13249 RepID=UPI003D18E976